MTTSEASIVYDLHEEEYLKSLERRTNSTVYTTPHESKESPTRASRVLHQVTNYRQQHHIHHISPIKHESNEYRIQFAHSTPNQHLFMTSSSTKGPEHTTLSNTYADEVDTSALLSDDIILPILTQENGYSKQINRQKITQQQQNDANNDDETTTTSLPIKNVKYIENTVNLNLKSNIMKQLAVSLLELNNLQMQNESLELQLKSKFPNFANKLGHAESLTPLKSQINKIKNDMLKKIDSINDLEGELLRIDHDNPNPHQRVHQILSEMKQLSTQTMSNASAFNDIFENTEQYSETANSRTIEPILAAIMKPKQQLNTIPLVDKINRYTAKLDVDLRKLHQKFSEFSEASDLQEYKRLVQQSEQQFEIDKMKLIKEVESEQHTITDQNRKTIGKAINSLQQKLMNFETDVKKFTRLLKLTDSSQGQVKVVEHKMPERLTSVPSESEELNDDGNNAGSGFDNDEDDVLRDISERIRILKEKIEQKELMNDEISSDDKDTLELVELTGQINRLKRKISHDKSNNKTTKIYLPLNHSRRKRSSDEDERLVKKPGQVSYQSRQHHHVNNNRVPIVYHGSSSSEDDDDDETANERGVKFYIVNKTGSDFTCSPERRYMSSIEIPAEQLEKLKKQAARQHHHRNRRSKSASSTPTTTTASATTTTKTPESVFIAKKSSLKQQTKPHVSKSMIAVSVSNPKVEKQTMTEDESKIKIHPVVVESEKQSAQQNKDVIYLLKILKDRDRKISLMKNKIIKLKESITISADNAATTSVPSYLDVLRNTIKNSLKNNSSDTPDKRDQQQKTKIDFSVQVKETDFVRAKKNIELVCTIPEHHTLEDLNHKNREHITQLKYFLRQQQQMPEQPQKVIVVERQNKKEEKEDGGEEEGTSFDVEELTEKRAEFEALDLAIGDKKKKLLDLEIRKRLVLNATLQESEQKQELKERLKAMRDEIFCLESTLKKRNQELNDMNRQLNESKRQISQISEFKDQINDELNVLSLAKQNLSNETAIFDRKADDATKDLILINNEIEVKRQEKLQLSDDLNLIKNEIYQFLTLINKNSKNDNTMEYYRQQNYYSDTSSIFQMDAEVKKQEKFLKNLKTEISTRKNEIETLRERGVHYTNEFKNEITLLKKQKIEFQKLTDAISRFYLKIDHKQEDPGLNDLDKLYEIEKSIEAKQNLYDRLTNNLNEIQRAITLENSKLLDLNENLNLSRAQLQKINESKHASDSSLNSTQAKYDSLQDDLKKCENELKSVNNELNSKKEHLKDEEEKLNKIKSEKNMLNNQIKELKENLKRKKTDMEKFDETLKKLDAKTNDSQNELKKTTDRLTTSKQEYEKLQSTIANDMQKLQNLQQEAYTNEQILNDITQRLYVKQNDYDKFNLNFINLQKQLENQQKLYEKTQLDILCEKKEHDNLKLRNKDVVSRLRENEYHEGRLVELETRLDDKDRFIEELEMKLVEKTNEMQNLDQDYLKCQDEIITLRNLIVELEDEFKIRESTLENELKNHLLRYEKAQEEYLNIKYSSEKRISLLEEDIHEKDAFIKQQFTSNSSMYNSLINYKPSNLVKNSDFAMNNLTFSNSKMSNSNLKQPISKHLIDEQQQKVKEILQNTISNRQNAFEQSKMQQIQNINDLKTKLHDVEMLSGSFMQTAKPV